ncbi:MAG TPA: SAM-dependent DNA methyltransferase, partial [Tissierellia bacterium]|nr:SAM-dependent DNA methyltransferase [Tissierellia bacterium]
MKRENMYYRTTNAEKVKALGQYFTPDVIAEFMAKWVSRDATTVLDPAAGNHIFFRKVRQANPYCQFYGYEIDPEIAMF